MRNIQKTIKIVASVILVILLLLMGSLLVFSRFYEDQVGKYLLQQVNQRIESILEARDIRFNVFRKFPHASLELRNVLLKTPASYQKSSVPEERTDTLLFAGRVYLQLNMMDVIKKHYLIRKIWLENSLLHIYINRSGQSSYVFWKKQESASGSSFLELREVMVSQGTILYHDYADSLYFKTFSERLNIAGDLLSDTALIKIRGDAGFREFRIKGTRFPAPFPLEGSTLLIRNGETYDLDKSKLQISGIPFTINGLAYAKGHALDLTLKIPGTEIKPLVELLPPNIKENIRIKLLEGQLELQGRFYREAGENIPIGTRIDFTVNGGELKFHKKMTGISRLTLSGKYIRDEAHYPGASGLDVIIDKAMVGKGSLSGRIKLLSRDKSSLEGYVKGQLNLQEVQELLSVAHVEEITGSTSFDLHFEGPVSAIHDFKMSDIPRFMPEGELRFSSVNLKMKNPSFLVESVNGTIHFGEPLVLENISFIYGKSSISAKVRLGNFFPFISGQALPLVMEGEMEASNFPPEFVKGNEEPAVKKEEIVPFPSRVKADIQFRFDQWQYANLAMSNVNGRLIYSPGLYMIQRFSGQGMGGAIYGDGSAWMKDNQKVFSNVQLNLVNIDITRFFQSFNNFGQDYITYRHLKGVLNGDLNARCAWVKRWKIDPASLVSFGSFRITNGELVGFDPIMSLSKFIEVSELRDIQFSDLENEIYIQDKLVTIPVMDIQSNAFNISLSGTHNFANDIDYHLKVRLSDLLARKAKTAKPQNEEFGVVEEDDLGHTSLYLSIIGTTSDYRIAYDQGAARAVLREKLSLEGQELRDIFREEFGRQNTQTTSRDTISGRQFTWGEMDSVPVKETPKTTERKNPKFRFTWEEDTTPSTTQKKKK